MAEPLPRRSAGGGARRAGVSRDSGAFAAGGRAPVEEERRAAVPDRGRERPSAARRCLAWALRAALLLALLPFGATGPFAMPLATLAVAVLAGAASFVGPGFRPTVFLQTASLAIAGLLGAYVFAQATGAGALLPPHPIWAAAADVLGRPLPGVAAVDPATALASLPPVLAPVLFFAVALRVFQDDATALAALRFVALVGGLVALFGLVQFVLAPENVLFAEKNIYRDSLTAVFVNRNSAATYLGCTALLLTATIRLHLGPRPLVRAVADMLPGSDGSAGDWRLAGWMFLLGVAVLALFLTKSRAGVGCSAIAFAFLMLVLVLDGRREEGRASRGRRAALVAATILLIGAAIVAFGGQTLLRAQVQGLDDPRFCALPSLLRAARENWPVGTGPGTFDVAFQPFRDPACGLYRAWDRAHDFFIEGTITLGAAFWAALLPALFLLVWTLVRGMRRRRRLRAVPAAGLACLALLVMHDLVDFSVQIPGIALNASLIFACCATVALGRNRAGSRRS